MLGCTVNVPPVLLALTVRGEDYNCTRVVGAYGECTTSVVGSYVGGGITKPPGLLGCMVNVPPGLLGLMLGVGLQLYQGCWDVQ